MDFSSVSRALESIERRSPAVSSEILDHVRLLRAQAIVTTSGEQEQEQKRDDSSAATVANSLCYLLNVTDRWEALAVGLFVSTHVLLQQRVEKEVYMEGPRVPLVPQGAQNKSVYFDVSEDERAELCKVLHRVCLVNLEHDEPRVRTLVAKAVGAYVKDPEQTSSRAELHTRLLKSIQQHIATGRDEKAESHSKSSQGALDDTTGWRALETNWQCLASLIAASPDYLDEFPLENETSLLDDCEHSCIVHLNRHVRAAGMNVLEQLVLQAATTGHADVLKQGSPLRATVVAVVKAGLADNWSQVRMAASVLCRAFWTNLPDRNGDVGGDGASGDVVNEDDDDDANDDLYRAFLPRMCLNRFYLAQGVKLYSHETWKMVFPTHGIEKLVRFLPAVCRYYVQMADADNHAVREAACQAMAELAVRLGDSEEHHDTLQAHVPTLLQALIMCFHDESWPVRDEACLACGIFVKAYPEECRSELKTLWQRWTEQLTDQIWSVRQDAGVALGDALEAYGDEMLTKVRQLLKELLPSARSQPSMTPAEYKARQNDAAAHTDSQLYSCGSLAPKLRKGGAGRIGCSSCDVSREKAPWEATDGCIYLVREVVIKCADEDGTVKMSDEELIELLTEVADVCRVQHFPQADDLRATLWRQLPTIANALGKDRFKRHYLDIFTDLLMRTLESRSTSALCHHAAGQCAEEIGKLIGMSILRGRLDDYQRATLDRVMREREMMPRGPGDGVEFSPFGPPGLLDHIHKPSVGV